MSLLRSKVRSVVDLFFGLITSPEACRLARHRSPYVLQNEHGVLSSFPAELQSSGHWRVHSISLRFISWHIVSKIVIVDAIKFLCASWEILSGRNAKLIWSIYSKTHWMEIMWTETTMFYRRRSLQLLAVRGAHVTPESTVIGYCGGERWQKGCQRSVPTEGSAVSADGLVAVYWCSVSSLPSQSTDDTARDVLLFDNSAIEEVIRISAITSVYLALITFTVYYFGSSRSELSSKAYAVCSTVNSRFLFFS